MRPGVVSARTLSVNASKDNVRKRCKPSVRPARLIRRSGSLSVRPSEHRRLWNGRKEGAKKKKNLPSRLRMDKTMKNPKSPRLQLMMLPRSPLLMSLPMSPQTCKRRLALTCKMLLTLKKLMKQLRLQLLEVMKTKSLDLQMLLLLLPMLRLPSSVVQKIRRSVNLVVVRLEAVQPRMRSASTVRRSRLLKTKRIVRDKRRVPLKPMLLLTRSLRPRRANTRMLTIVNKAIPQRNAQSKPSLLKFQLLLRLRPRLFSRPSSPRPPSRCPI